MGYQRIDRRDDVHPVSAYDRPFGRVFKRYSISHHALRICSYQKLLCTAQMGSRVNGPQRSHRVRLNPHPLSSYGKHHTIGIRMSLGPGSYKNTASSFYSGCVITLGGLFSALMISQPRISAPAANRIKSLPSACKAYAPPQGYEELFFVVCTSRDCSFCFSMNAVKRNPGTCLSAHADWFEESVSFSHGTFLLICLFLVIVACPVFFPQMFAIVNRIRLFQNEHQFAPLHLFAVRRMKRRPPAGNLRIHCSVLADSKPLHSQQVR